MRKIEQQIIAAIKARRDFIGGNTQVSLHTDTLLSVTLYRSVVAVLDGNDIRLAFCDFNTPTTVSRINCLLAALDVPYYAHIVKREGCFSSRADHKIVARGSVTLRKAGDKWGNV